MVDEGRDHFFASPGDIWLVVAVNHAANGVVDLLPLTVVTSLVTASVVASSFNLVPKRSLNTS